MNHWEAAMSVLETMTVIIGVFLLVGIVAEIGERVERKVRP